MTACRGAGPYAGRCGRPGSGPGYCDLCQLCRMWDRADRLLVYEGDFRAYEAREGSPRYRLEVFWSGETQHLLNTVAAMQRKARDRWAAR